MKRSILILLTIFAIALPALVRAKASNATTNEAVPYPLQTCIVSGEHLEAGQMVVVVHQEPGRPDRVMHFCCRKCLAKFKANPAKYLEELDAATAAKKPAKKG